jgi:outer membrane protein TolC
MDAAMARYVSKIKSNETSHARYQRVRVAQKLVSNIKGAFYRLLALNMALPKAKNLVGDRFRIVQDLDSLARQGLIDAQEKVYARDMLAQARRVLVDVQVGIEKQRELLAASLNICPTSCFTLQGDLLPLPQSCLDPCKLEKIALVNRPEAYQADLAHLSSIDEYKRLIVKCFPRVEGYLGYYRDENKFLLHNDWADGGMRITWDLMEFTADLFQKESASNKMVKTERETALVSMGILSQVKIAAMDAISAIEEYKKLSSLVSGAREKLRIARDVEEIKEREAREKVIRIDRQAARADMLEADIKRIMAAGEAHGALAELDATVGVNYPIGMADSPPKGSTPTIAVATQRALYGLVETAAAIIPRPW